MLSKPEVTVATTKKELDWVDATEYVNKNIAEEKLKKESAGKETVNEETGDKDTVESVLHSEPVRPKYEFVLNFHMPHDSLKSLGEGLLLAAPGIGMLLGFAPVSKLIFKVGIKNSLFVLGLLSSFGMAFIPLVLGDHNRIYLIVARIFLGFISAGTFASIGSHIIKWQPIRDQTSSLNLSMLSIVLGPLFSWPLVYFCDGSTSTKNVHYVLAVLTIIISIIFYFIYRNNPSEHAWVKGTELFKIQTRKVLSTRLNKNSIMKVLKSFDTWNIVACSLAYFHLISFAVTLLPIFAATVLKKEGHSLIMSSTTPIILQILSHVAMHYLQKSLELSNSVYRTRMCNSIAYFTSALFLASCMVVFSKNLNETIIYTLVACSFAPIGFVFFGFLQCTTSIGKLYGQYIITLFQLAFALALTFTPFLAIFGASNNLLVEWKFFFLIIAIIFLLCNIAYILLVETQPLDFAENSWLPDTKDTNQTVRLIRFEDDCGIMEMKAIKK
uniref:MFS domain-containing protein n=1 Tax=Rhabditophanes sp. KR3021 TaxID=114890 RepID=A0AC35U524_9BILA